MEQHPQHTHRRLIVMANMEIDTVDFVARRQMCRANKLDSNSIKRQQYHNIPRPPTPTPATAVGIMWV